jgi:hypothetical protein
MRLKKIRRNGRVVITPEDHRDLEKFLRHSHGMKEIPESGLKHIARSFFSAGEMNMQIIDKT